MVFEGADVLGRFHRLHLSVLDRHDQICDQLIHKPESPGDPEPTVDLMFQVGGKHFLSRIIGRIVDPIGELRTSNPNRVLMKPDRQIAGLAFEGQGSQMGLVEPQDAGFETMRMSLDLIEVIIEIAMSCSDQFFLHAFNGITLR